MLTYRDALCAIFERTNYELGERPPRPPYAERVWRLARVEELLSQFDNPQRAFRSLHVAGTKGKGSTTAMIDAILRAAGYSTGMYTSPHLHTFRERIRIEGQLIPERDVVDLVGRMLPILDARPEVTVFEIITALAMWYYAQKKVDFGVFEVGMGGRLDTTNVLLPLVSVITSISLDHVKVLGDTIGAIAGEKAGIIKPGIPVVTSPQRPEAMRVIRDTCAERGTSLVTVGRDWGWHFLGGDATGQRFSIYRAGHEGGAEYPDLTSPLLGDHQLENACTAVAAIEVLREQGVAIEKEAIRRGLANVHWPGRMEILGQRPLVVVDGAHNAYSARRLLESLQSYLHYERIFLVFGAGHTHNPGDQLALLLPASHKLYMTQAHHPRATPSAELQDMAQVLGRQAPALGTVEEALRCALDEAGEDDLVLVTGSLFVVAEAQEAWAAFNGLPPFPSDPPGAY